MYVCVSHDELHHKHKYFNSSIPIDCYSIKSSVIKHNHTVGIKSQSLQSEDGVIRLHDDVRGMIPIGKY
jgi:hypothetical protein